MSALQAPLAAHRPRSARHRRGVLALAALGLAALLGALAATIAVVHQDARHVSSAGLTARGVTSAQFVSTYLSQQATRETQAASEFLRGPAVSARDFRLIAAGFGGVSAGLFSDSGRLLNVMPDDPALIGTPVANRYPHVRLAETGRVAVSNVNRSAVANLPVVAIAVPFATSTGRRVLSVAFLVSGTALDAFVAHTISYPQHNVFIVDASGSVVSASPSAPPGTLAADDPTVARAIARGSQGAVRGAAVPSTYNVTPIPGTSWRLVIAIPNSRLYASSNGWSKWAPWIAFAAVTVLALVLFVLFARFLADRDRLGELSAKMEHAAGTDLLTGLSNRRTLAAGLTTANAYSRRHDAPLSVLMIDLDHFKEINDQFGHDVGDRVLQAVADCMHTVFRDSDHFGRWGGDEFLAVLSCTAAEGAFRVAERLRGLAASLDLSHLGLIGGVALSVGCTSEPYVTADDLLARADDSLYNAKRGGRGRVTVDPEPGVVQA